jgi:hypothetical protein
MHELKERYFFFVFFFLKIGFKGFVIMILNEKAKILLFGFKKIAIY